MALSWRRRGQAAVTRAEPAGGQTSTLNSLPDLCRSGAWEQLSDEQRMALLAPYAAARAVVAPAGGNDLGDERSMQAEIAASLGVWMQRAAHDVVRTWLADASPDAHLVLTGDRGLGRLSLAAALLRQEMATQPTPPDYCYVPDPEDITRSLLLTLPAYSALPFAYLAESGRQQLLGEWANCARRRTGHGGQNGVTAEHGRGNGGHSEHADRTDAKPVRRLNSAEAS